VRCGSTWIYAWTHYLCADTPLCIADATAATTAYLISRAAPGMTFTIIGGGAGDKEYLAALEKARNLQENFYHATLRDVKRKTGDISVNALWLQTEVRYDDEYKPKQNVRNRETRELVPEPEGVQTDGDNVLNSSGLARIIEAVISQDRGPGDLETIITGWDDVPASKVYLT
jgi:hypothetical protein